jgi:hypothetical protein
VNEEAMAPLGPVAPKKEISVLLSNSADKYILFSVNKRSL